MQAFAVKFYPIKYIYLTNTPLLVCIYKSVCMCNIKYNGCFKGKSEWLEKNNKYLVINEDFIKYSVLLVCLVKASMAEFLKVHHNYGYL